MNTNLKNESRSTKEVACLRNTLIGRLVGSDLCVIRVQ